MPATDFRIEPADCGVVIVTPDGLRLTCANRALADANIALWTGQPNKAPVQIAAVCDEPDPAYQRRWMREPEKKGSRVA